MAINVIDKYLSSKKKKLYSYCRKLNKIIGVKNNIFVSSTELNDIISFCCNYYVDNLFLKDNFDFEKIKLYYKYTTEDSDTFNKAYFCLINYYENKSIFNAYSLKVFYLIILLGFSFEIDKNIEIINTNRVKYRNIINGYINTMNNEAFVLNKNYEKLVNELIAQICLNKSNEDMFFNTMKMENAYNTYSYIDRNSNYFIVNFNYKNDKLDTFNKVDVSRLTKTSDIKNSYMLISYELSCIEVLKLLLNEKFGNKLVMKIDLDFCKKASNFKKMDTINRKSIIKDNILLMLSYEEICDNTKIIDVIKSYGYSVVINYKDNKVDNTLDTYVLTNDILYKGQKVIYHKEVIKEELL